MKGRSNKVSNREPILPTTLPLIPADRSVFQKTRNEKVLLKKAKRIYRQGMFSVFGKDWKYSGYTNVPIKMLDENKYKESK